MIYPTRSAIFSAAAGGPFALLVGVFLPTRWYAGLAWPLAVLVLTLYDALTGARPGQGDATLALPPTVSVGAIVDAEVAVDFGAARAPHWAQVAFANDRLIDAGDGRLTLAVERAHASAALPLTTCRRGTAKIDRLWLRWRGAMGLVWKQRQIPVTAHMRILPDIRPVQERGAQIFQRHALQGLIAQIDRGDGNARDRDIPAFVVSGRAGGRQFSERAHGDLRLAVERNFPVLSAAQPGSHAGR